MGQKVNPNGFRVGVIKDWNTRWYASKKDFSDYLVEDKKIRDHLKKVHYAAGVAKIDIERAANKVTVSIHTAESAVLEVTDTGIGISPENQEKIFDPFYRVDKSRSRAMGGAGLGLALVSEIARQHNGQVKVTQSSEKGSTIALMLPVTLL